MLEKIKSFLLNLKESIKNLPRYIKKAPAFLKKLPLYLLAALKGVWYALKYVANLREPIIRVFVGFLVCSLASYAFDDTAGSDYFYTHYAKVIKIFYVLMVIICLFNAVSACYSAAGRQLNSPKGEINSFRIFNGFLIGFIAMLPFIIMCIVASANGYTYYKSSYGIQFAKIFYYLFSFPFVINTVEDFSYMQYMCLSFIPIIICGLSYLARLGIQKLRDNAGKNKEAA